MPYITIPHFCGIYYLPSTDINILPEPSWLPQVSLSTRCKIHDTASSTILTQTFINPSATSAIEQAKYNFPLYESCAVVSFRCYVGDRLIEGVVKEKEQARTEYNQAIDRGETAGLLEQQTPDVFRTSLGNIPAGKTVKVQIEYIMELKHDAEVDGLRFTIPTSIAPRYGVAPSDVGFHPGATEKGMTISVQITMPSNIRSVRSPSHPIVMHLGGHEEDIPDHAFDPKCALANLSQSTTVLGNDFVLLVNCADLSSPRALLEKHSSIPGSKALMVTLVPKFTLPPAQKPEVVFVADRSGSMNWRMDGLRSSLSVFLKSLPLGVKFNICSFGSSYSFLWDKSQSYSAQTLEQAQKHVDGMQANLGGTEIYKPIKATIERRFKDLPLEIMVLTDGEVWNSEELFKYIEEQTADGNIRLFSLGIGMDVSHALVEGMARVGRGFAQIVTDEREGLESKVVRMLKGGLSAHVKDYRLEWKGRSNDQKLTSKPSPTVVEKTKISLFDTKVKTDAPVSFSTLPDFVVPDVLQAPFKLPPLFPFSRSTVYAILSPDVSPPSCVWLRGTTPTGDELELEIEVQPVEQKGQTIHQLAARKILQELEEGTGYLHSGRYGVDKVSDAGTFGDWVQREGVRVGVKYGLASKWTSFVAVQTNSKIVEKRSEADMDIDNDFELVDAEITTLPTPDITDRHTGPNPAIYQSFFTSVPSGAMLYGYQQQLSPGSSKLFARSISGGVPPPPVPLFGAFGASSTSSLQTDSSVSPPPRSLFGASGGGTLRPQPTGVPQSASGFGSSSPFSAQPTGAPSGLFGAPPAPSGLFGAPPAPSGLFGAPPAPSGLFGAPPAPSGLFGAPPAPSGLFGAPPAPSGLFGAPPAFGFGAFGGGTFGARSMFFSPPPASGFDAFDKGGAPGTQPMGGNIAGGGSGGVAPTAVALIALQTFEGSFPLSPQLATILGTTLTYLETKLTHFAPIRKGLGESEWRSAWATVLAIALFEKRFGGDKDVWELVVEKARMWMVGLGCEEDLKTLYSLGEDVLSQTK